MKMLKANGRLVGLVELVRINEVTDDSNPRIDTGLGDKSVRYGGLVKEILRPLMRIAHYQVIGYIPSSWKTNRQLTVCFIRIG